MCRRNCRFDTLQGEDHASNVNRSLDDTMPGACGPFTGYGSRKWRSYRASTDRGTGSGRGTREAIVGIPRNTWVSVRNIGKTPISLLFAFNAPGFDRYMRCESVSLDEHPRAMTDTEERTCTRLGDVQYR